MSSNISVTRFNIFRKTVFIRIWFENAEFDILKSKVDSVSNVQIMGKIP